jgi:aerobic-type carbon monoxide dehydrogenase small subunit (CoxS/CutS family)
MNTYSIDVNGQVHLIEADPQTPLLWVLRDTLGLTGTNYSCGIGQCGACTVHLDDKAVRSCRISISEAVDHRVTTIEGLSVNGDHALQQAWLEGQVPQCGYCQPGQIMQAAALLKVNPNPTQDEIINAMSGNLCRCGSYQRILNAVQRVVDAGSGT